MNKTFKPFKARLRASFAAGGVNEARLGAIDKEGEILHDVQITLEGEALGHGIWLDRIFCEDVAKAGNEMGDAGVKVRFGHPAMCSDALGTYLGRAKNFRVVDLTRKSGEKAAGVIADIHIASESHSAPSGDLGKWVLEAAENSPDTFGQSIVFTYGDLKYFDEGKEEWVRASERDSFWDDIGDRKLYACLGKLLGTDFTDTPAATDGVFSQDSLAAEAEAMLDEHPQIVEVLEKHPESVVQFLERTGLDKKIESARLSGLQAAKDKEIGELKKALDETNAKLGELETVKAELEAVKAERDEFKTKIDQADEALAKVSSLEAEIVDKDEALAASRDEIAKLGEQLENCRKAAAARGESVNNPPAVAALTSKSAREQLAALPPNERAAFYAAHRAEIDGNIK